MSETQVLPVLDFSSYIVERTQDFTGREWVFERIDRWLAGAGPQHFLLTGGPGSGKSALAARLVQLSQGQLPAGPFTQLGPGCLAFYHFCQARRNSTLEPLRFVKALSESLARRYPAFREALLRVVEERQHITVRNDVSITVTTAEDGARVTGVHLELPMGNLSARRAFELAVGQPLESLCGPGFHERILILVDSLDEALTYDQDDTLVGLLGDVLDLPAQVRLLMTSREDDQVSASFGAAALNLSTDAPVDNADVQAYAYGRLAALPEPGRTTLAGRVAAAAGGNFLYTRYVIDDLLRQPGQLDSLATLPLPADLQDVYRQFLKRELARNLKDWARDYRPVLGLLAVARGQGLTKVQLAGIAGRPLSETSDILAACDQYLIGARPEGPFRLYHQSFRDFLLADQVYQVYPGEASQAIAQAFLSRYQERWLSCSELYALRHTASHLGEAAQAQAQPARHELTRQLVELVLDQEFQEATLQQLNDLSGLQQALELALRSAVADDDQQAVVLIAQIALAHVVFRRERLNPAVLFELARAGELQAAVERLRLFPAEREWQQAILLTLAWLAGQQSPAEARALCERVAGELASAVPLQLLAGRVRAALDGVEFPHAELPPLPHPPGPDAVYAMLARVGSVDDERSLYAEGLGELQQTVEVLLNQEHTAVPLETFTGDARPMYLAEQDSPMLVAYAIMMPDEGTEWLKEYLRVHAANSYVIYRNRSLWGILDAVLRHPDPTWVLPLLPLLESAALSGGYPEFEEALPLTILALQAQAGAAGAEQQLDERRQQLQAEAGELYASRGAGDSWGRHKRRLAAMAEAYALLLQQRPAALDLLQQASSLPFGYAGFHTTACLVLGEAIQVCQFGDQQPIDAMLQQALEAAHNIQDASFCAQMTARVQALLQRWWNTAVPRPELAGLVRRLAQDPGAPEFAAVHMVGDGYPARRQGPNKIPLPPWMLQADTLGALARLYKQPLESLLRVNRDAGWSADQPLPPGTLVNVPDPDFAPLLASRLAADVLAAPELSARQQVELIQVLVPLAVSNPTALNTTLARLLLAARPARPDSLRALEKLAPTTALAALGT